MSGFFKYIVVCNHEVVTAVRTAQVMVISALGEDPLGQWWPTCPSKWTILVMGMRNSANFSNSKRHVVSFRRITQAKLSHLTGNKKKSSFQRNRAVVENFHTCTTSHWALRQDTDQLPRIIWCRQSHEPALQRKSLWCASQRVTQQISCHGPCRRLAIFPVL